MAENTLPEIAPNITPPSSTRPVAAPISREQMASELGKSLRPPGGEPKAPPTPKAEPVHADQPKEYIPKNPQDIPKEPAVDFRAGLRDKVMNKEEPKPAQEKKPAVSADDAPPPEKPKATEDTEVPEDQRKVLPHDKPETARRIKAILAESKKKDEAMDKLSKELEEARKTAVSKPSEANLEEFSKLKEEYGKANDELIKFRRRYEIDNDETFKKTYDEPLSQTEKVIEDTLKKYNLGDATLKAIRDEGGFGAFSRSMKTFPIVQTDADGEKKTVHITAAELSRSWLNNGLAVADAEFIKSAVGKQALLTEEKKAAVARALDESKQFFETRNKQQAEATEAAKKRDLEMSQGYQNWLKSTTESTDWLKDEAIPENANEAKKTQIQEKNEFNKQLRESLATHPKNQDDYYKLRLEAVESHHLRREMGAQEEKIKSLEAELARVKAGTRTTSKPGSLLTNQGKDEPKPEKVDMNDPMASLKKGLRAKMAARSGSIEDE